MNQFCHNREGDFFTIDATVLIDAPLKDDLHRMFTSHSNQTIMNIGVAIKCETDAFVKRLGREAALKNQKYSVVELNHVEQNGTKHIYCFTSKIFHTNHKHYKLYFKLTTVSESESVKLIYAYITEQYDSNIT